MNARQRKRAALLWVWSMAAKTDWPEGDDQEQVLREAQRIAAAKLTRMGVSELGVTSMDEAIRLATSPDFPQTFPRHEAVIGGR